MPPTWAAEGPRPPTLRGLETTTQRPRELKRDLTRRWAHGPANFENAADNMLQPAIDVDLSPGGGTMFENAADNMIQPAIDVNLSPAVDGREAKGRGKKEKSRDKAVPAGRDGREKGQPLGEKRENRRE